MMHLPRCRIAGAFTALALAPLVLSIAAQDTAGGGRSRVCAAGDVTLGTNLDTGWTRLWERRLGTMVEALPRPDSLLAPVAPLFAGADVVVVNLEGAIGEGRAPRKCGRRSRNCFAMRMPVSAARALRRIAADTTVAVVANIANNHSGDAGLAGREATISHLRAAGVMVTGADTLPTVVVTRAGDTVAVLGFGTSTATPDARDHAAVARHVARAAASYPRLVVTMHLGGEGAPAQRVRDREERLARERRGNPIAFARAASAAGARLIAGHGPHVLRAVEWRQGALIAYSLGNFVTYGPFSFRPPNDRGAVLCAALSADGRVSDAELRASYQRPPGFAAPDSSRRALALVDSLGGLDLPRTRVRIAPDGRLAPPEPGLPRRIETRKERPLRDSTPR